MPAASSRLSSRRIRSIRRRMRRARFTAAGPRWRTARKTSVRASAHDTRSCRVRKKRRRAEDSRSRTTSFTIVDESRYTAMRRSSLGCAHPAQSSGGACRRRTAGQGRPQLEKVAFRRGRSTCGSQRLKCAAATPGNQHRHGVTALGDLDSFSSANSAQNPTRMLLQLANPNSLHVRQCSTWGDSENEEQRLRILQIARVEAFGEPGAEYERAWGQRERCDADLHQPAGARSPRSRRHRERRLSPCCPALGILRPATTPPRPCAEPPARADRRIRRPRARSSARPRLIIDFLAQACGPAAAPQRQSERRSHTE